MKRKVLKFAGYPQLIAIHGVSLLYVSWLLHIYTE